MAATGSGAHPTGAPHGAIRARRAFDGPNILLPGRAVLALLVPSAMAGGRATLDAAARRRLHEALLGPVRASRLLFPQRRTVALLRGPAEASTAEVVAALCLELQRLNGEAADGWRVLGERDGLVAIAYGCETERTGLQAVEAACALADAAPADGAGPVLPETAARYVAGFATDALDLTVRRVVSEAGRRGIPWRRVDDGEQTRLLVRLGEGRHRRTIFGAVSDRTPLIGTMFADRKPACAAALRRLGLPAPRGVPVRRDDQAVAAARALGYPVVVKPASGSNGRGVSVRLVSDEEVVAALRLAQAQHPQALVEEFIPGHDHRLLVLGGRLVAAARRDPPEVVGDGRASLRALAEAVNRDPRRSTGFLSVLSPLAFDAATLAELASKGLEPESVPAAGERVTLRRTANLATGAVATDVTAEVHPDNRRMAEMVAAVAGLDIVGIDFLTPDIARPFSSVRCAINEINIRPALRPHLGAPGRRPDATAALLDHVVGRGAPATIPLVAVAGSEGADAAAEAIGRCLDRAGLSTVVVSGRGVVAGGLRLSSEPRDGDRGAAEAILDNPLAEAGVMTVTPDGIHRHGLGFGRTDVAVLLAPVAHAGDALALAAVAGAAQRTAVVEAACADALAGLAPQRLIVVCHDEEARERQLAAGRRVVARGAGGDEAVLLPAGTTRPVPEGKTREALVAAAVALALDLPARTRSAERRGSSPRYGPSASGSRDGRGRRSPGARPARSRCGAPASASSSRSALPVVGRLPGLPAGRAVARRLCGCQELSRDRSLVGADVCRASLAGEAGWGKPAVAARSSLGSERAAGRGRRSPDAGGRARLDRRRRASATAAVPRRQPRCRAQGTADRQVPRAGGGGPPRRGAAGRGPPPADRAPQRAPAPSGDGAGLRQQARPRRDRGAGRADARCRGAGRPGRALSRRLRRPGPRAAARLRLAAAVDGRRALAFRLPGARGAASDQRRHHRPPRRPALPGAAPRGQRPGAGAARGRPLHRPPGRLRPARAGPGRAARPARLLLRLPRAHGRAAQLRPALGRARRLSHALPARPGPGLLHQRRAALRRHGGRPGARPAPARRGARRRPPRRLRQQHGRPGRPAHGRRGRRGTRAQRGRHRRHPPARGRAAALAGARRSRSPARRGRLAAELAGGGLGHGDRPISTARTTTGTRPSPRSLPGSRRCRW